VAARVLEIPVSVLLGAAVGLAAGAALHWVFLRFNPRATKRVLIALGVSVVLLSVEDGLHGRFPFSGLMAVMALAFIILEQSEGFAHEIAAKLAKIWVLAEILLFVLVGAQVDVAVAWQHALAGAAVIAVGLVARSIGVNLCLAGAALTPRERLFCTVSYIPKATVQAAIGALPLAAGLPGGQVILAVAVLAVILTAPIGAWATAFVGARALS
jgi:solute carrier family 9B (sodium/hydrogen exchanger), member 1/2